MKMRNNSKTKHAEKKLIINNNKNNNYDSNNNDLKDGQDHWLEMKQTLIWIRNWSGLYAFDEIKHYTTNSLKQRLGEKKKIY